MSEIIYPFELSPSATATQWTFQGAEEGQWTVELTAQHESSVRRVRLAFAGVTQVRINDDWDRAVTGKYLLMQISKSPWVERFLEIYVKEFGTALLPVVKNKQHFIVRGHDSTIGLLARSVECAVMN